MSDMAQCAHSRVTLRRVGDIDGTVREEWWCSDCVGGTRFVPMRDLESARTELEAHMRQGASPNESHLIAALRKLMACSHNPPPVGSTRGCNCFRMAEAALKKAGA